MSAKELFTAGERCGPYRVERELGRGGMGCVYLARGSDGELVALKAILPSAAGTNVERFQWEARIVATIDHVNLARFKDAGRHVSETHGTVLYMVMEYLAGQTLRAILDERGPLGCKAALRYSIQIADALMEIHRHDIVHRDLKPQNVLIVNDTAKVIDLGIAKIHGAQKTTERHLKVGTLSHMAPEQLSDGPGAKVGPWTDGYQLGLLLSELVSGRHPLIRPDEMGVLGPGEFIARALLGEPEPLTAVATDVPEEVAAIVARALAKKPEDRPTVLEMREAMNAVSMQLRLSSVAGSLAAIGGADWTPPTPRISRHSLSGAASLHQPPLSKTAPLPVVSSAPIATAATDAAIAADAAAPVARSRSKLLIAMAAAAGALAGVVVIVALRVFHHGAEVEPRAQASSAQPQASASSASPTTQPGVASAAPTTMVAPSAGEPATVATSAAPVESSAPRAPAGSVAPPIGAPSSKTSRPSSGPARPTGKAPSNYVVE